jgi:hypothetical protein
MPITFEKKFKCFISKDAYEHETEYRKDDKVYTNKNLVLDLEIIPEDGIEAGTIRCQINKPIEGCLQMQEVLREVYSNFIPITNGEKYAEVTLLFASYSKDEAKASFLPHLKKIDFLDVTKEVKITKQLAKLGGKLKSKKEDLLD